MDNQDVTIIEAAVDNLKEAYKPGGHSEVTANFYSDWAGKNEYEKHLNADLYRGPFIAAESVAEFYPNPQRSTVRILDVAAGTGFVAENLKDLGFERIDALDPSEGMLRQARDKGLYQNIICAYLDDKALPCLEDTYDCAVCSGGMGEGHIPPYGLDQLIRVVKPGGLISIVMREAYLEHGQYADKLEPHMNGLASKGCWELVSREIVPKYCFDHNGIVYKYRVLATKSFQI